MIQLSDPITIQRRLANGEDISGIIISNDYYYVDPNNSSITINSTTKLNNEERLKIVSKKLKELYQIGKPSLSQYLEMRNLQQERMIRYLISDEITLLINSYVPLESKMNKYNRFFNCQDLSVKMILYCYKQNYELLFGHMDKKFNQFWNFINRLNKTKKKKNRGNLFKKSSRNLKGRKQGHEQNHNEAFSLSQSSFSSSDDDDEEGEDEEDDEDVEDDEGVDIDVDDVDVDVDVGDYQEQLVLNEDMGDSDGTGALSRRERGSEESSKSLNRLVDKEIHHYWNCLFMRLYIYFKLNEFDNLSVEFWNLLIESKPINGIDALESLKNLQENIVTKDELIVIITISLIIVKPIRELRELLKLEKFINFLQLYKDSGILVKLIHKLCDCSFVQVNNIVDLLLTNTRFHMLQNHSKIQVYLRQKQYILILSTMSRIPLHKLSELVGVDAEVVLFETRKMITFLQMPISYNEEDKIFEIMADSKTDKKVQLINSLNELYLQITSNNEKINEFNSTFPPP